MAVGLLTFLPLCLTALASQKTRKPAPTAVWRDASFQDFAAGTLDNAGANLYVSKAGRLQTIHHWDYNDDGYIDLLFNSTHDTAMQVPAALYAGSKTGLSAKPTLTLPTDGGKSAVVGDLNGDGYRDIALINGYDGIHSDTGLFIYWGSTRGYSVQRRAVLFDDKQIAAAVVVHLPGQNSDGLALAFTGEVEKTILIPAYAQDAKTVELPVKGVTSLAVSEDVLYAVSQGNVHLLRMNRQGGVAERQTLPGAEVQSVVLGDVDGDGQADLLYCRGAKPMQWLKSADPDSAPQELPLSAPQAVVADFNKNGKPVIVGISQEKVVLLTATDDGWQRAAELPGKWAAALGVGDWNGDGWPDLTVGHERDADSYETNSWVYWGGAQGFSVHRKQAVETAGAAAFVTADLTRDGQDDLLCINRLKGRTKGDIPAMLYWGSPGGKYGVKNRTLLPTIGAYESVSADFNDDGYTDLLVCCAYDDDPYSDRGSMLFWGTSSGLDLKKPAFLPTKNAIFATAGDLNRDGYLDLVVSEFYVSEQRPADLRIFWGGPRGYRRDNSLSLKFPGLKDPRGSLLADLNRDGRLDIVVSDIEQTTAVIYWGQPNGFDTQHIRLLPAVGSCVVQAADLNRDGWLDLVVGNFWNPTTKTQRVPSYIYWGGPKGFDLSRRVELETFGTHFCGIADLNRDGFLDLVFSCYHGGRYRSLDSYIYWGAKDGYRQERRKALFNDSAAGGLIADFNEDGWLDICFSNHTRNGNHSTLSRVFWNEKGDFAGNRVTRLPSIGPHFMGSVDIGNLRTRQPTQQFTSRVYRAAPGQQPAALAWKAVLPPRGGAARFQLRSGATPEALQRATWQGPQGSNSYFTQSGASLRSLPLRGPCYQYRVFLDMTAAGSAPRLERVEVRFGG